MSFLIVDSDVNLNNLFSSSLSRSAIPEYFIVHPQSAKLNNLNLHPLASRYRDPQLQVGDNYSRLFI